MTRRKKRSLIAAVTLLLAGCGPSSGPADVAAADRVFMNGAVYTVDQERSWAEAVAVTDGRIVYVGDNESAASYIAGDTEIVDLVGQMLLPGFHDSHIHIMIGTMAGEECSLLRLETPEELTTRLKECTSLTGIGADGWILGGGWGDGCFRRPIRRKGCSTGICLKFGPQRSMRPG